jgi:hypothetical protein
MYIMYYMYYHLSFPFLLLVLVLAVQLAGGECPDLVSAGGER